MAEQIYSTDPLTPHIGGPLPKHVPFTVYASIVPTYSDKRQEVVTQLAYKWAQKVQEDLAPLADDVGITIAKPVAFTPQFGQYPPRVTINGTYTLADGTHFLDYAEEIGKPNTSDVNIESSGEIKTGNRGGSLSRGQTPTTTVNEAVAMLKSLIESYCTMSIQIFKIHFAGITYGEGGVSFP